MTDMTENGPRRVLVNYGRRRHEGWRRGHREFGIEKEQPGLPEGSRTGLGRQAKFLGILIEIVDAVPCQGGERDAGWRRGSGRTGTNGFNSNYDRDSVAFDEGDNNPQEADAFGGSFRFDVDFANDMTLTSVTAYETVENSSFGDIDGGFGADFLPTVGPCPPGPPTPTSSKATVSVGC